ncbi:hypothetical protein H4217_007118 [Coemansia sp. RSA 1939]|nr:hypothetical protein H4217_007118 [Coemansia sp. RSA 1939]KAJ2605005.1 hypothetical protein EV177_006251 [Coemansia sp. RSA 1804]KAJ2684175.1 hypothetical protein GGH99_004128 [Coemansia sp. RSA 1285]
MAVDRREVAVIGVNTALMAVSLAAIVYVNINRGYIPLKCKNIPLLNTLFCAMVVWYIGDIYTYQPTVVANGGSRGVCIVTMSWLRMSLGVYTVVSCHVFRIYQYHCIFRWRVRATGRRLWIPVAAWTAIPLAYGVLASALPANRGGNDYIDGMCVSYKPLYFVAVVLLVLLLVVWACATLMMRGINVCFDEYRELLIVIGSTVVVVALQVALRWVPGIGDTGFSYNSLASITDVLIGQISLLVLIARPMFHCIRDRDRYLRYFLHTLRREDRETEYELANGGNGICDSSNVSSASAYSGDLLLPPSCVDYSDSTKVAKPRAGGLKDGEADSIALAAMPDAYRLLETLPHSPIRLLV